MTVLTYLEQWKATGAISGTQSDAITALARKDRFSVFVELNTALYLGVLALAGGISWTMTTYSARLGDAAVLSSLTCVFGWSRFSSTCRARSNECWPLWRLRSSSRSFDRSVSRVMAANDRRG